MNRIRDLREDRDLRQIDVANAVGIDQQTISNYETERTRPDSEALIRLADYFGVSIDYLLGHTPPASDDERRLLTYFRSFTPGQRHFLLEQAEITARYKIKSED